MAFRSTRTVQRAIIITLAIVILAMWMTTAASVQTARQAALDHARSEGGNLAVAFADEVERILDGVDTGMGIVAQRMRANPVGRFDIYAWASEIPLLSDATIQRVIIGPNGMLHSTTLDPMPAPLDLTNLHRSIESWPARRHYTRGSRQHCARSLYPRSPGRAFRYWRIAGGSRPTVDGGKHRRVIHPKERNRRH
jgi:hypothetical protein